VKRPTYAIATNQGAFMDCLVDPLGKLTRQLLISKGWERVDEDPDLCIVPSTDAMMNAQLAPSAKKILVLSDGAVYGETRPPVPMDESEILAVDSLDVDSCHVDNQLYYMHFERSWLSENFQNNTMIVRGFGIADCNHDVAVMLSEAREGSIALQGDGSRVSYVLDTDDAKAYMARLVNRLMHGSFGVYNVGSRLPFTQYELAKSAWQTVHGKDKKPVTTYTTRFEDCGLDWPTYSVPDMVRTRALTGLTFQEKTMRSILKRHYASY